MNFISIICAAVLSLSSFQLPLFGKPSLDKYHEEILEMSVEDNLHSPEVPGKYVEVIKDRQMSMAKFLKGKGMKVETTREGLAVVVTIPAAQLFFPNDTVLRPIADKTLAVIGHYLKTPDFYKVLVVVHSDDTGSDSYLNDLTESRSNAVVDWFSARDLPVSGVIPYGYGADEPIASNISRKGRETNRRVEFYFIPGPEMIKQAKSKKL